MTKLECFRLKNILLAANIVSNMIGVAVVYILLIPLYDPMDTLISYPRMLNLVIIFSPSSFITVTLLVLWYERPIRQYLNLLYNRSPIPADLAERARRRLLNEPFVLIALAFGMWLVAAMVFSLAYLSLGMGYQVAVRPIFMNLVTGLITVTLAFFVLEYHLQKHLVPVFFPKVGLIGTPKTLRIRIITRMVAILFACNLIPFAAILGLFLGMPLNFDDPIELLGQLRFAVFTLGLLFMATSTWLVIRASLNLTRPINEMVGVLRRVKNGDFNNKVRVVSNDEIGYTGDVINQMTEGLKERERLRHSMELAMEIQRSLLPLANPATRGFDIAGASIYCDETGGDYYDFLELEGPGQDGMAVALGDVSGHGIPSALLMTTARAFLRLRFSLPAGLATVITDVNRQLARDLEGSGRFMTMFCLVLDRAAGELRWVRAGHDPAILYDPASDSFEELGGEGMVLGISPDYVFGQYRRDILTGGQVLFLGTDGIWEATNLKGEMFGKEAVCEVIRRNADATAEDIQNAILAGLRDFQGQAETQDDVTLVVIKAGNEAREP